MRALQSLFRICFAVLLISVGFPSLVFPWMDGLRLGSFAHAAESTDESIALYADAANFQTGGATDLAIESWTKFLDQFPDDDLASKAAHYLGVCHMQKENPDYDAAAKAFALALQDKQYELREESLANLGWCYYASAGDGPKRDTQKLQSTIQVFNTLRKENPASDYIDRAYFYIGEALYGLGKRPEAIQAYDRFLALKQAKDSPLRCDVLYAKGIAQEEIDLVDQALQTYQQLLQRCADSELSVDVHLRIGDIQITNRQYAQAIESFDSALTSADTAEDKSYAIFRQAYALVQDGKPAEAAKRYERLQTEFPNSTYAAGATLASAQSLYRAGDLGSAAERFEKVLAQKSPKAATEAAHWLARIHLSQGNADQAVRIARKQIAAGTDGEFAFDLKVDLAEALSLDPKTVAESAKVSEQAYRESPEDPLAPRALYNAAFSALQINDFPKAQELANEFLTRFENDELASDVRFIVAESQLLQREVKAAIGSYRSLLESADPQDPQRSVWVLRAATALNSDKAYDETVALLKAESSQFQTEAQKAEANFVMGRAQLMAGDHDDAAAAFERCIKLAPEWPRVDEAKLMRGTALLSAEKPDQAQAVWKTMISAGDATPMADQARYKLAQMASSSEDHPQAIEYYDTIIKANRDPGLIPYALYGHGWSLMQIGEHADAVQSLDRLLDQTPGHRMAPDALIARGISHRALGKLDQAESDLQQFLQKDPQGAKLGHALYELALVKQKQSEPDQAAQLLKRLMNEVPDYPDMENVLYELGWSLRESGDNAGATKPFEQLLEEYPDTELAGEAAYYVGQQYYAKQDWKAADKYFRIVVDQANDLALNEKAHYRLGWSYFKQSKLAEASEVFSQQIDKHPDGALTIDGLMMVGECEFKQGQYKPALAAYTQARDWIRSHKETSDTLRDAAERQVRELILLHGGQSAAQLQQWDGAIAWYNELKERFPSTAYLPQMFYESGFAYQQKGEFDSALRYFSQVADRYRNEIAARARFMMGEIHFGEKQFDKAIPEFQRVMYGFGADKAPESIKNWQAKSGFEAARCSELLMQSARNQSAKNKSRDFAKQFYQYVVDKHPKHELATKSAERLGALESL